MNRIIISDTSCLIVLDRIDHLFILQKCFGVIFTTPTVLKEFGREVPEWIISKPVQNAEQQTQLESILDPGEASAIALTLETEGAILIIDEKKGRRVARSLNIEIIGTLRVLLIAKQKGIIPSVMSAIDLLQQQSFRFNKAVINEVLLLAGEI